MKISHLFRQGKILSQKEKEKNKLILKESNIDKEETPNQIFLEHFSEGLSLKLMDSLLL